jgi:hypothetical protein
MLWLRALFILSLLHSLSSQLTQTLILPMYECVHAKFRNFVLLVNPDPLVTNWSIMSAELRRFKRAGTTASFKVPLGGKRILVSFAVCSLRWNFEFFVKIRKSIVRKLGGKGKYCECAYNYLLLVSKFVYYESSSSFDPIMIHIHMQ